MIHMVWPLASNVINIISRILAVGWNNHIVEFPDTHENDVSGESDWITVHDDDIFTAAVRSPDVNYTKNKCPCN